MPSAPGDFVIAFDKTNLDAFLRIAPDQVPFAMSFALNKTAQSIKTAEYDAMRAAFDRPTPYVLRSLQFPPWAWATKRKLEATIGFKDGAWQYVGPHAVGQQGRSLKRHEHKLNGQMFAIARASWRQDVHGNMPARVYSTILSHLGAHWDRWQNITQSERSKRNRRARQFFVGGDKVIYERRGRTMRPTLVPIASASYRKRLTYFKTAHEVMRDRLWPNFVKAFETAMAHSHYRTAKGGKWRT